MNILILGATSDIARALSHTYASHGHTLMLAARNIASAEKQAQDLQIRYSIICKALHFDAADIAHHPEFYHNLPYVPDVVICVFGVMYPQLEAQNDRNKAMEMLHTNYVAAVSILECAANDMEKRQSGTIIGISSVAGDRGRGSNYLYGSAKAGFTAYLSGLRNRLSAANVHVMTVKPGFVKTAMTEGLPLPKPLTAMPEQVAADIYRAANKKKNTLYTLWMWRWIMLIIQHIPEFLFKKMKL